MWGSGSPVTFRHPAATHDLGPGLPHTPDARGQIVEGIGVTVDHHEVSQLARLDGAQVVIEAHELRRRSRGRLQRSGRAHAALDHQRELTQGRITEKTGNVEYHGNSDHEFWCYPDGSGDSAPDTIKIRYFDW